MGAKDKNKPIRIYHHIRRRRIFRGFNRGLVSLEELEEANSVYLEKDLYSDFESKIAALEEKIADQGTEKSFWSTTKRTVLATIIVGAVGFAFTEVPKQYLIHQWTKGHFKTKQDCQEKESFVWFPQKKDLIDRLCKDINRIDIAF